MMDGIADNALKILLVAFVLSLAILLGGNLYRKANDPNWRPLYTYGDLIYPTPDVNGNIPQNLVAVPITQPQPQAAPPARQQVAAPPLVPISQRKQFILPAGAPQPDHTSCIGQADGRMRCWDNR
jgi:hypothetical protein